MDDDATPSGPAARGPGDRRRTRRAWFRLVAVLAVTGSSAAVLSLPARADAGNTARSADSRPITVASAKRTARLPVATTTATGNAAKSLELPPVPISGQLHYAAPARTADGRIDVARTLDELVRRGSRTYSYLIYPKAGYRSADDWATLPQFLAAARARGVKVMVTLTPPTSTSSVLRPCTADRLLPYQGNYDRWMIEIGRLARAHPNLVAVGMDDFGYSTKARKNPPCPVFGNDIIERWNRLLLSYARREVRVIPTLYVKDLVGGHALLPAFRDDVHDVVWPYWNLGNGLMKVQYAAIKKAYPELRVHIMVYARPVKQFVTTPEIFAQELTTARALNPASVTIYQQHLG